MARAHVSCMQRLSLLAFCSLLSLGLTPPSATAAGGRFEQWLGTYENSDVEQSERIIERAIDSGTQNMGLLKRKIARKRLNAVNRAYRTVRIEQEGDQLITDFEGRRYAAPVQGGEARGVDPDGKPVTVSYTRERQTLYARYVGEDGEKRIAFELDLDGDEMIMHVTVTSGRLPEPIRYALGYERVE